MSRTHTVQGGGGVALHVREWGNPDGRAIVFIHGWSQNHMCWAAQTGGDLAKDFRLVALDLRGHGMSEAPANDAAYTDTRLWGDDIAAVIAALALERPTLVGWSYAGRVIAAYLETHGADGVGAIALAGSIMALGRARDEWMIGAASPSADRDLYAEDQPARLAASLRFIKACTHMPMEAEQLALTMGVNMLVSAQTRLAMFKTDLDLRPCFAGYSGPALIVHGAQDSIVAPRIAEEAKRVMPQATLEIYDDCGHAPFLEHADRFNADLRTLQGAMT